MSNHVVEIMDKKDKKIEKEQEPELKSEKQEEIDKTGFPEDVDFKKFLGCGG